MTSYAEYYHDVSNDPWHSDYAAVYQEYALGEDAEAEAVGEALATAYFANASVQPQVVVYLQIDSPTAQFIGVLHRPYTFRTPTGMMSGLQSNEVAFLGDVVDGQIPTVFFPHQPFHASAAKVTVPTVESLRVTMRDPRAPLQGPLISGAEGTEDIFYRPAMWVAPAYARHFLASPLSPQDAWRNVAEAVIADGQDAACAPLIDWLRVAVTLTNSDNGTPIPIFGQATPRLVYPPHRRLSILRKQTLERDLPGLRHAPGLPLDDGANAIVKAIDKLTREQRTTREEAADRANEKEDKDPQTYYGVAVAVLFRLCQVGSSADLPGLYHEVAKSTKKNERLVIQEQVWEVARDNALDAFAPHIDPGLAKCITTGNYLQHNLDDLTTGIQPFRTVWMNADAKSEADSVADNFDALHAGAGAQLSDLSKLHSNKVRFPSTFLELGYSLKSFLVLCVTLFGEHHPLVTEYHHLVLLWDRRMMVLESSLNQSDYPKVLRWLQTRTSRWIQRQHHSMSRIQVPSLTDLIDHIEFGDPWAPTLPQRYLKGSRDSGDKPSTNNSRNNERLSNNQYDPAYEPFRAMGLSLKLVRDGAKAKDIPIPKNDNNQEMCLSYHVLGTCWSNCQRVEDHRTQTKKEKDALLAWCKRCYREGGPS